MEGGKVAKADAKDVKTKEVEDPFLKEAKILADMSPEDRYKYVVNVVLWISSRIKYVATAKSKVKMLRRFNKVTGELKGRGEELMICILWTVKPEFRTSWMEFLGRLVGMDEDLEKLSS